MHIYMYIYTYRYIYIYYVHIYVYTPIYLSINIYYHIILYYYLQTYYFMHGRLLFDLVTFEIFSKRHTKSIHTQLKYSSKEKHSGGTSNLLKSRSQHG